MCSGRRRRRRLGRPRLRGRGHARGHASPLFEPARTRRRPRAPHRRRLPARPRPPLDNGQHILIGAYRETLALMRTVGVDPDDVLLRLPLSLRCPDGSGLAAARGCRRRSTLLAGIATARGWTWRDKAVAAARRLALAARGFRCAADAHGGRPVPRPARRACMDELIEPLCVSALNTPAARASGQVFLRVLRDALFGERGGANLLLPRVDLGAPAARAALHWLGRARRRAAPGHARGSRRRPARRGGWRRRRPDLRPRRARPARRGKQRGCCATATSMRRRWIGARPRRCASRRSPRSTSTARHAPGRADAGAARGTATRRRSSSSTAASWAAGRACWPSWSAPADGDARARWSGRCCAGAQRAGPGRAAAAADDRREARHLRLHARPARGPRMRDRAGLLACGDYVAGPTPPRWKAPCAAASPPPGTFPSPVEPGARTSRHRRPGRSRWQSSDVIERISDRVLRSLTWPISRHSLLNRKKESFNSYSSL